VFIPTLFVPTTWSSVLLGLGRLNRDADTLNVLPLDTIEQFELLTVECADWFEKLHAHLWTHFIRALLDLLMVPFVLIAYTSPLRHHLLRKELGILSKLRSDAIALDPHCALNTVGSFEFEFSWTARGRVVHHALSSLVDYLALLPAAVAFCVPSANGALRAGVSALWIESDVLNVMKVTIFIDFHH
jgi:hypothetical protein